MATFVAFLRAINLGPTRKFPKPAIVAATEAAGFEGVETHINTGNVRLETRMRSAARIEARLESAYAEAAGFDVPTIVLSAGELRSVVEHADRLDHGGLHYVSLLKESPTAAAVRRLEEAWGAEEVAVVGGRAVHLLLGSDYHSAKLSNATIEKALGPATNRNLKVLREIAAKWCS